MPNEFDGKQFGAWSGADVSRLIILVRDGLPAEEIATRLRRELSSVLDALVVLQTRRRALRIVRRPGGPAETETGGG